MPHDSTSAMSRILSNRAVYRLSRYTIVAPVNFRFHIRRTSSGNMMVQSNHSRARIWSGRKRISHQSLHYTPLDDRTRTCRSHDAIDLDLPSIPRHDQHCALGAYGPAQKRTGRSGSNHIRVHVAYHLPLYRFSSPTHACELSALRSRRKSKRNEGEEPRLPTQPARSHFRCHHVLPKRRISVICS